MEQVAEQEQAVVRRAAVLRGPIALGGGCAAGQPRSGGAASPGCRVEIGVHAREHPREDVEAVDPQRWGARQAADDPVGRARGCGTVGQLCRRAGVPAARVPQGAGPRPTGRVPAGLNHGLAGYLFTVACRSLRSLRWLLFPAMNAARIVPSPGRRRGGATVQPADRRGAHHRARGTPPVGGVPGHLVAGLWRIGCASR
jgi:hypothetical protein